MEDFKLERPTRAKVLEQEAQRKREQAERELPPAMPEPVRRQVRGEQVELFSPQGSLF